MEKALFAGGCFWCMVEPFDTQPGIETIISGYAGGHVEYPTYEEVKSQTTGHREVVEITFDPEIMSYEKLLEIYWQVTDPTDAEGQYMDRGESYSPAIYYYSKDQKESATASKKQLEASQKYKKPIVVPILEAPVKFYQAEDEHQDFHVKNEARYQQEKEERAEWAAENR
jgi:peptide-methionine (S)-S-oxide reductase